ncbi:MAG: hypothetical protein JWQ25_142 [Daejeonella sp.]|nr:hypothetical protein [Daejeonella sp.]
MLIIIMLLTASGVYHTVSAQCAMCTMNAESSVKDGNTEGKGLNSGILYLLAAPYLAIGVVGYIWFKKYRKKDIVLDIKDEKINLN